MVLKRTTNTSQKSRRERSLRRWIKKQAQPLIRNVIRQKKSDRDRIQYNLIMPSDIVKYYKLSEKDCVEWLIEPYNKEYITLRVIRKKVKN